MNFNIVWKIDSQPKKMEKFIKEELAPELSKNIYKIIAIKGDMPNNAVYSAKEFIRDEAGLFTQGALKEFVTRGMIKDGSRIITSISNDMDRLEFEAEIADDFKNNFLNDPIPYILKRIGNLTPEETSKVFDDVVGNAKEKLKHEEAKSDER